MEKKLFQFDRIFGLGVEQNSVITFPKRKLSPSYCFLTKKDPIARRKIQFFRFWIRTIFFIKFTINWIWEILLGYYDQFSSTYPNRNTRKTSNLIQTFKSDNDQMRFTQTMRIILHCFGKRHFIFCFRCNDFYSWFWIELYSFYFEYWSTGFMSHFQFIYFIFYFFQSPKSKCTVVSFPF